MTSRPNPRFLAPALLLAAAAFGCAAPDRRAPDAPQVFEVALTAATPAGLPQCTKALQGTTAATESPAGIWTCQGTWVSIPCTNGLGGAVAYASATKSLWACTAGQWVNVVLPAGPQGQTGTKGDTGAPGKDGKAGATSIVAQTVEPAGVNCSNGGTRVASGVDGDGDHHLADGEIMEISYVCNGAPGPAGANGAPGAQITVTPEAAGTNCPNGGQRIAVGVDANGNGALDDGEAAVSYVCNGGTMPADGGGSTDGGTTPADGGDDGGAPADLTVSCASPALDAVVNVAPGSPITFKGVVRGATGTTTLAVNGVPTMFGADGAFSKLLTTRYGLNHVVLDIADATGRSDHTLCSFLVAEQYANENTLYNDTVALRLNQSAIDDGVRTGPIDSLADVLATAINSDGLPKSLHEALLKSNPVYKDDSRQVDYQSLSLPGPNTVSATLVDGGIKVHVRIEDPLVHMRVGYEVFPGVPTVHTTGEASADFMDVDATFDVAIASGRPTARPRSVAVTLGTIDTHFDGLLGLVLDIAVTSSSALVRDIVSAGLRDSVNAILNDVLDNIVSNLDVASLGTSFSVPRFDGTGTVRISFGVGFSTVVATPTRALVGLSTKFVAPAAHTRLTLGVPFPTGTVLDDPASAEAVTVAEHVGVLQQALQAYWRGGGLDGAITTTGGANVAFTTMLPPVVFIQNDGSLGLDLGVSANVSLPGATAPIQARAAIRARATATLSSDDPTFSDVTLTESRVVTADQITDADAATVGATLIALLTQMAERSLNDSLPQLPVPAFTIPEALAPYGLPAGAKLGIVDPALTLSGRHAVLRGAFGVR